MIANEGYSLRMRQNSYRRSISTHAEQGNVGNRNVRDDYRYEYAGFSYLHDICIDRSPYANSDAEALKFLNEVRFSQANHAWIMEIS